MFIQFLNLYGLKIACVLFLAFAGWLGMVTKKTMDKYVNTDAKRAVAKTAMMAVEQLYKDIHGPEKMHKAMLIASGLLKERGIKCSVDEMRNLIEEAVCEFNANYKGVAVATGVLIEGTSQLAEAETE